MASFQTNQTCPQCHKIDLPLAFFTDLDDLSLPLRRQCILCRLQHLFQQYNASLENTSVSSLCAIVCLEGPLQQVLHWLRSLEAAGYWLGGCERNGLFEEIKALPGFRELAQKRDFNNENLLAGQAEETGGMLATAALSLDTATSFLTTTDPGVSDLTRHEAHDFLDAQGGSSRDAYDARNVAFALEMLALDMNNFGDMMPELKGRLPLAAWIEDVMMVKSQVEGFVEKFERGYGRL